MPRSKLPVVALLLAAVAGAIWLFWSRGDAAPAPTPNAPETNLTADTSDGELAATDVDEAPQPASNELRTEATATGDGEPEIADGEALLRVTTVSKEGGAIVRNVKIRVQRMRGNRISRSSALGTTDEHGRAEFAGLTPGKYYLSTERRDQKSLTVEPGLNEFEFEVKPGVDVTGMVTDPRNRPVANAEIWLQTARTSWEGARVLGHSDETGKFELVDLPPGCSLGAIGRGFAPSALVDLDIVDVSSMPARVDLQLRPGGGGLTGIVTDSKGEPIAGAQVAAGKRPRNLDYEGGRFIEAWSIRTVETDSNGRYTLIGLRTGTTPLTARAPGFGIWRGEAKVVAAATTTLDIELSSGAIVHGHVKNEKGEPEVGATVSAYDREPGTSFLAGGQIDFDETFGGLQAITDENGRYRIENVTPGEVWMFAQRQHSGRDGISVALARETLTVEPGSDVQWDPVIDPGRTISGIVRYRDGHPIPYLFVTLQDERSGEKHTINSSKDGTFRFLCLEPSVYEVRVQPPFDAPKGNTAPRRSGVVPDQGIVEFTVDYDKPVKQATGTVSGRIADSGARIQNPNNVTVTINSDAGWFRPGVKIENGAFRVEDVKPCKFRVILKEGETVLASSDWHELPPGGDVDTGVLATETGGSLRVLVNRDARATEFEPNFYLRRDGDALGTRVEIGRKSEIVAASLTPGDYKITAYFKGMVALSGSATVVAGQTTDATFDLRAGAIGKVAIWWPEGQSKSKTRGYRFTDATGRIAREYEGKLYTSPLRPYELSYTLAPGRYHLEFWTDDGLRGETDMTIPESLKAPEARVDLR